MTLPYPSRRCQGYCCETWVGNCKEDGNGRYWAVTNSQVRLPSLEELAELIASSTDTDVIFYSGAIRYWTAHQLTSNLDLRAKRSNVMLILVTWGGDPSGAYKIARFLQDSYQKFSCYVTGVCKSAGTLIALGAHEIIMSSTGELGPLDMQITKRDEVFESQSGLVVATSLRALREEAFDSFEDFVSRFKNGIGENASLKMATEVAARLTTGLFGPIYTQLDPASVGETNRSMQVVQEYGHRLRERSRNCPRETVGQLIESYPSHDFVIDRAEARTLFFCVNDPTPDEALLVFILGGNAISPPVDTPDVRFLSGERSTIKPRVRPQDLEKEHD